jgi:hypothetical protein
MSEIRTLNTKKLFLPSGVVIDVQMVRQLQLQKEFSLDFFSRDYQLVGYVRD